MILDGDELLTNKNNITGRYRLIEMEIWDKEYLDEETAAFISIQAKGSGEFHFGYVHGFMDCSFVERDGRTFSTVPVSLGPVK